MALELLPTLIPDLTKKRERERVRERQGGWEGEREDEIERERKRERGWEGERTRMRERENEIDEEQYELRDNSGGTNQHERGSFHP